MFNEFPVNLLLVELAQDNLLPAILFRTSRRQCDQDVEHLARLAGARISAEHSGRLEAAVAEVVQKYGLEEAVLKLHPQYAVLLQTAVGAHHAGQLLAWRLLLEELMSRGLLRLMIATGTVAAGVDFPARTVVITAHSKRGSDGFKVLTAAEFQQMSGRAGRRGKDTVGFCIVAPGFYSDARVLHQVAQMPPEPLRSAYFAAPATVLNLLKYRSIDELRYTVSKSLAAFIDRKSARVIRQAAEELEAELRDNPKLKGDRLKQSEKKVRRRFRDAEQLEQRQQIQLENSLGGLRKLGHIDEGGLTAKGLWAAELCTNLVLELAEAIASGLFYDLQLEELVGLVASIAGDPHREYLSIRKNPLRRELFQQLSQQVQHVADWYQAAKSATECQVREDAALTVLSWLEAQNWQEYSALLKLGKVAPGDASRLISQTADHLNQISHLRESHPELAALAWEGRKLLLRPPINDGYENDM